MAFEQQRQWVEESITNNGGDPVSVFRVAGSAREICGQYYRDGNPHEVRITCVPGMTKADVERDVLQVMQKAAILA